MKKIIIVSIIFTTFNLLAQQKEYNYQKINTLLNENSISSSLKVIGILKKEFINDSINATYWISHARASQTLYKSEEAKISIEKAIQKDSLNAEVYYKKGVFYGNLKDPKTALQAFSKAISINPSMGVYYYNRAIISHQTYLFNDAENDYKKAMECNFITDKLYNNYAKLLLEKGNYYKALHQINNGISINNNFLEAYKTRATIHYFLLDFDAACADKKIVIEKNPNSDIQLILPNKFCTNSKNKQLELAAKSFIQNNRVPSYKQAIIAFTKLLEKENNSNPNYYLDRGFSYFNIGEYEKANNDFDKAILFAKEKVTLIYENIISLYANSNKLDFALKYTNKQITYNPKNHKAYNARGVIYLTMKKYKLAEKDFKNATKLKSDFAMAYENIAILYLKLSNYDKAKTHVQKAINLNRKSGNAYLILGKTKYHLGITNYCDDFYKAKQLHNIEASSWVKLHCNNN